MKSNLKEFSNYLEFRITNGNLYLVKATRKDFPIDGTFNYEL